MAESTLVSAETACEILHKALPRKRSDVAASMIKKKHCTRLSQEHPAGVKCRVILGLRASQAPTSACLCAA